MTSSAKTLTETLTVAETRIAAASRAAFKTFMADLPDTPHPGLDTHRRAATSKLFEVQILTIDQLRHAYDIIEPVDIQRDHLRRIDKGQVAYLGDLHLTHVQYVWVVDPETHKIGCGDGNTRQAMYFVKDNAALIPDHVVVLVYYPLNREMARDIYHCIDSAANHKRTTHDVTSMYRACGMDVDSLHDGVVGDGYLVSAFRRLAKVHGLGSIGGANGRDTLEKLVTMYRKPLEWLNEYQLKSKELNQGFLGTALWLYQQDLGVNDKLTAYLKEIRQIATGEARVGLSTAVTELWAKVAIKSGPPETVVSYTFAHSYLAFQNYLAEGSKKTSAAERKRLSAAAAKLSLLPKVLAKHGT